MACFPAPTDFFCFGETVTPIHASDIINSLHSTGWSKDANLSSSTQTGAREPVDCVQ